MTTSAGLPGRPDPLLGPLADDDAPCIARIYDRLLGGAHNFAPDRQRADQIAATYPRATAWTWANRTFQRHAVEHCLALGIDQFLDLGSGIPTVGNVHEIIERLRPGAPVAYVDHESSAAAHSRTMLAGIDDVTITEADLRDPEAVLSASGVAGLLDLDRPVGVLAMAVVHFVPDADDPATVLSHYRRALAAGSVLALTHTSNDLPGHPEIAAAHRRVLQLYATMTDQLHSRSRAEIRAMVEAAGFAVDADGLVEIGRWGPPQYRHEPLGGYALITEPLRP